MQCANKQDRRKTDKVMMYIRPPQRDKNLWRSENDAAAFGEVGECGNVHLSHSGEVLMRTSLLQRIMAGTA
ncbi:hypothetical protein BaRGS_00010546 [Batillaria attramentaria]|uniref:Uncharacterized protein n=1 Tax=Batillaria attramentaria TaxID=370345 RepID=A0ABD0LGF7_9CAEN